MQKYDSGRDDTANADILEMLRKNGADKFAFACHNCDAISHEVWQSRVAGVLHLQGTHSKKPHGLGWPFHGNHASLGVILVPRIAGSSAAIRSGKVRHDRLLPRRCFPS